MRERTIAGKYVAWVRTLAVAGILGAVATAAWAVAGDFDGTFGSGGVTTTWVDMDSQVRGVAVQSDGRVLLAGFDRDVGSPGYSRWRIRRYGTGGALDTTFGSGGSATLFSVADEPVLFGMALDGDDILAAGQTRALVVGFTKTTSVPERRARGVGASSRCGMEVEDGSEAEGGEAVVGSGGYGAP